MLDELSAWLRSFKAPRKDVIRVACIGNSITYGSRLKNRERDAYPAVLGRMLGDGYWVKNFGIGSRTMLNKGDHLEGLLFIRRYICAVRLNHMIIMESAIRQL